MALLVQVLDGWDSLLNWLQQTLAPALSISLRRADGSAVCIRLRAGRATAASARCPSSAFRAVELPDDLTLWKTISLPKMSPDDLVRALALEAKSLSPFPVDDLIWVHQASGGAPSGTQVDLCLMSRPMVDAHLDTLGIDANQRGSTEVWARHRDRTSPMVVPGYGETRRYRVARKHHLLVLGLMLTLGLITLAAALTPTFFLRAQTLQAHEATLQLGRRAANALESRSQLSRLTPTLQAKQSLFDQSIDVVGVLAKVSESLPADVHLSAIQMNGERISLRGIAPNTATLMNHLSAVPGVHNVRAPVAAQRQQGTSNEVFLIELSISKDGSVRP